MPLRGVSGGGVSGGAIILGADQARAFKEDDAFDRIEQQEVTAVEQGSEDATMWQDGWEGDCDDGQYAQHLRAELERCEAVARDAVAASAHGRPPAFSPETVLVRVRVRVRG